ncbi:MAG: 4-(cytidine 5'-diphospho)-2-C-methyl-D-erythritol kinase [Bryobacteraceae bacterium]
MSLQIGSVSRTSVARRARVRALAKINLDLRVLHRRPDGYHAIRTVFQTVSLGDTIDIEFRPARRTKIELNSNIEIGENLVVRAARLVLDAMRVRGEVRFSLKKIIPMGAGLGGGSTDAGAVLLALPVLAGKHLPLESLHALGLQLGSDVPFFLYGGTAAGLGRGEELYPLPTPAAGPGLLVASGVHVSTAEAYQALGRELTSAAQSPIMNSFQTLVWNLGEGLPIEAWASRCENDFEAAVFARHPRLKALKRKLQRLGATPALMTGSGSALFGLFRTEEDVECALPQFREERALPISLVSRSRYRSLWFRQLRAHVDGAEWPPRSRYA